MHSINEQSNSEADEEMDNSRVPLNDLEQLCAIGPEVSIDSESASQKSRNDNQNHKT